jgi:hypothetical protein
MMLERYDILECLQHVCGVTERRLGVGANRCREMKRT